MTFEQLKRKDEALRGIAELYAIEARGRGLDGCARHPLRGQEALPKLQAMHDGLQLTRQSIANVGALANTMDYSLKRRVALSRYANSATLPIDNPGREHNPADRGG